MSTSAPLQEPQRRPISRGLDSSIWASNKHENVSSPPRPDNWPCMKCNFANFHWRVDCFRCGLTKYSPHRDRLVGPESSERPQEKSGTPTQLATQDLGDTLRKGNGLSASRWATSKSRQRNVGREKSQPQVNQPVTATHDVLTAPNPPTNTSLPYDVQHFVLAMMERIVEEGCFEFASRWDPEALITNNWSCAEAVELSTWRTFFMKSLPSDAISSTPRLVFEDAMADAVRLRNAAVHRHLCDNVEIRRMTISAQGLMTIFSDVSRHGKFVRLESELREWDNAFHLDPTEKRWNLEAALLEINERPLDTMDWTPNRERIQIVMPSAVENAAANHYSDEMDDEMDVD